MQRLLTEKRVTDMQKFYKISYLTVKAMPKLCTFFAGNHVLNDKELVVKKY